MSKSSVLPLVMLVFGIAYLFDGDDSDTKTRQSSSYTAVELAAQEKAAWNASVRALASVKARGCGVFTVSKSNKSNKRAVYDIRCDRGGRYKIDFDMNVVSYAGGDWQRF